MNNQSSRREFLRWSAGFSILGSAAPFALSMATAGAAAAQTATSSDYKAVICLFMQGGQDANNMILATDTDSFTRYTAARPGIALMGPGYAPPGPNPGIYTTRQSTPAQWPGVLPINPLTAHAVPALNQTSQSQGPRTFAIHPLLSGLYGHIPAGTDPSTLGMAGMFNTRKNLAVLANVGTLIQPTTKAQYEGKQVAIPPSLASHLDQQNAWQAANAEAGQSGWGGRIGDILGGVNGSKSPTNTVFTAVSAGGNALFLSGNQVNQYQISNNGSPALTISGRSGSLFGSSQGAAALASIISKVNGRSNMADDFAVTVGRSITCTNTLNAAVDALSDTAVLTVPDFQEPIQGSPDENPWTDQLFTIMQLIAAGPSLGIKRQVFFAMVNAHDTHADQNDMEALNMARLNHAMAYIDAALSNLNGVDMRANVTTFTASEFSSTFTSNGTGTDHGWGGHQFIMGGAVKGGEIYGQYPTIGANVTGFTNPDLTGNNFVPTTSVDQYGATLANWMGVAGSDLATVFPNLANWGSGTAPLLGFI